MNNENLNVIIESVDTLTDIAKKSIEYLKKDYPVNLDWINTQLRKLNEAIVAGQIRKLSIDQKNEQERLDLLEQQKKTTNTRIKNLNLLIMSLENEKKQYLSEINYYGIENSIKNVTPEEQKLRYSNALKNLQILRGREEAARRKLEIENEKAVTLDSEIDSCKKTIEENNQTISQLKDGMQNIEVSDDFVGKLGAEKLQLDIENKKKQFEELSRLKDILFADPDNLKLTLVKALENEDYELFSECLNQFEQIISPLFRYKSEIHERCVDFKQSCDEKSYYSDAARAMDVFQLQRLEFEQRLSKNAIERAKSNRAELENKLLHLSEEHHNIEKLLMQYSQEREKVLSTLPTAYMQDDKKEIDNLTMKEEQLNQRIMSLKQELDNIYRQYVEVKKQIDFFVQEKTTYNIREQEIQKLKSKINEDNYIDENAKSEDEKQLKLLESKAKEIDKTCDLFSTIYNALKKYCQPQLQNDATQEGISENDITLGDTPESQKDLTNDSQRILEGDITFEDTPEAQQNFEVNLNVEEDEEEEEKEEETVSGKIVAIKDATVDLVKKVSEALKNSRIGKFYKKRHEKKLHQTPKNYRQLKKQLKHYIKKHLNSFEDWEIGFLLEKISRENGESVKEQFNKFKQADVSVKNYLKMLKEKPADHIVIKVKSTEDGEILNEPEFKINPFASGDKLVSIDKKLFDELMLAKAKENEDSRRNNYGK